MAAESARDFRARVGMFSGATVRVPAGGLRMRAWSCDSARARI